MKRKRILTIIVCAFFLTIGLATSTRQDGWRHRLNDVERDIRRLEERRDSLVQTVADLEHSCEEQKSRISEQEISGGDQNEQ